MPVPSCVASLLAGCLSGGHKVNVRACQKRSLASQQLYSFPSPPTDLLHHTQQNKRKVPPQTFAEKITIADVHASNQAAAGAGGGNGGGGNGGGGDDGKRPVPPGKAHYDDSSLEEIWSQIFNFSSGSAGMRKKHTRCVRCGREASEHHRQNWQLQKCTCVLCGDRIEEGHFSRICPRMQEHREFFNEAWVRSALKGYRGVRKGELPPPLSRSEFKSRRKASFEEQKKKNADAAAQTQQNAFNPMGVAMGEMASQMLMGMCMGMRMGILIPMAMGMAPMPHFTPSATTAFGGVAAPAAPQQQQSGNSSGRGGRVGRGGGRNGRGG